MRLAVVSLLSVLATPAALADADPGVGQSRAGFELWRHADHARDKRVAALEDYLRRRGAGGVLPLDQVLRTDERYGRCGAAFDVPPKEQWPDIVPTLRLIRDEVKPALGEVVVVSGFRRPPMNRCVGGSSKSRHLRFGALDLRPKAPISNTALAAKLCAIHARKGPARRMGLGLYPVSRFHVDTSGFRTWGADYTAKSSLCRTRAQNRALSPFALDARPVRRGIQ